MSTPEPTKPTGPDPSKLTVDLRPMLPEEEQRFRDAQEALLKCLVRQCLTRRLNSKVGPVTDPTFP